MDTQKTVVVRTYAAAYVGTVKKTYKDESVLVEFNGDEQRFTRFGKARGKTGVRFQHYTGENIQQYVDAINAEIAAAKAERDAKRDAHEQEYQRRVNIATLMIEVSTKQAVETVAGPLYIYNLPALPRNGKVALMVKGTGEESRFQGGSYWSIAVAEETSMAVSSEIAQTADAAAIQYVAKVYVR